MESRVKVRLVPKTTTNLPIEETFGSKTVPKSKNFKPDKGKGEEALKRILNMGLDAQLTKNNSLTVELDTDRFKSVFKTGLKESLNKRLGKSFTLHERSITSESKIELPSEMNEVVEFAYIPSSPEFFSPSFIAPNISHYYLDLIDVLRSLNGAMCHRRGWTGRNVRVAMTDTGFSRHPFFESQGYHIERIGIDQTSAPQIDISGHGTGESANTLVVAPDCQFIGVKHDDYSALALETALEANPHIITNSWGWDIDTVSKDKLKTDNPNLYFEIIDIENIIIDAINDGVCIVFAAGNGHYAFPACIPEVISVGGASISLNGDLKASNYASSFTSMLYPQRKVPDFCGIVGESGNPPLKGHIMLPVPNDSQLEGENMPIRKSDLGWGIFSGTSAAAPQIAGVIALMLSVNQNLIPTQIKRILSDTSIDVSTGRTAHDTPAEIGRDDATGAGLVNAFAACIMAQNIQNII